VGIREGTSAGAQMWNAHSAVLRAIDEAAGIDSSLDALWRGHTWIGLRRRPLAGSPGTMMP